MLTPVRSGELRFFKKLSSDNDRATANGWVSSSAGNTQVFLKQVPRHELVREVACSLTAQAVGLPTPICFVVDASQSTWGASISDRFLFATEVAGLGSYVRVARSNQVHVDELIRWPELFATIAFDTWIGNEDRTVKNLLFLGRNRYAIIDHGEALPPKMRADSHYRNTLARHLIAQYPKTNRADLAHRVLAQCRHFGQVDFGQILIAGLAEAWGGNPELSECCRLLRDRLTRLPELIETEFNTGQGQIMLDVDNAGW